MEKEKIEDLAIVDTPEEKDLGGEVSVIETRANAVVINSEEAYKYAADLTKQVKTLQKKVTDYWEPIYRPAYNTYKTVNDHKNDMLKPLKSAEAILKKKMSDYYAEVEAERKRKEQMLAEAARKEKERMLAEAVEAEARGDAEAAEYAMANAEMMENASVIAAVNGKMPKADGVSYTKVYSVEINEDELPLEFGGIRLWKIPNKSLIEKLVKESQGKINIPGVKVTETIRPNVRTA